MKARFVLGSGVALVLAACAASSSERSTTPTSEYATTSRRTPVSDDASVAHLHHEPWGEFTIGGIPDAGTGVATEGPSELVPMGTRDAGASSAPDAGSVSAELAWLVAHIADTPDRLRSDDSDNGRQLASRGADGIRAVVTVFARGDARRLPFARRVVERNIVRVCGAPMHDAAQELINWIELGGIARGTPDGILRWSRTGDSAWPTGALARLDLWLARGMPCTPPDVPSGAPPSSNPPTSPSSSSPRPVASGRDAAASRRP